MVLNACSNASTEMIGVFEGFTFAMWGKDRAVRMGYLRFHAFHILEMGRSGQ